MRKSFTIPLIEVDFYIYVGDAGWKPWRKQVAIEGAKMEEEPKDPPSSGCGRTYGSWIWLGALESWELIAHELTHFVDDTMRHVHSTDGEFHAYVSAWVHSAVLDWVQEMRKLKKRSPRSRTGG